MKNIYPLFLLFAGILTIGCNKIIPPGPADNETLDGPIAGLSPDQLSIFSEGEKAFNEVFSAQRGLGPLFVSTSCVSCHAGDGKGHLFTSLVRFGQSDTTGNAYYNTGGPQLQHRAIPGYIAETLPAGAAFSRLVPPANSGLGFIEAIADADLLALQDPADANGDGISGRVNMVGVPQFVITEGHQEINGRYIGRFGKKAAVINLMQQTVNAYIQDMGITSDYNMQDLYHVNNGAFATDNVADPEVPGATVNNLVFYLKTLKAPGRRNAGSGEVLQGQALFTQLKCNACHKESFTTGPSPIAALSNKQFSPYSDFLLHDMGPGLDDGYTEGSALTGEWRTAPLWGLGLSKVSQGGQYFLLHDGRARSIEQAIEMHGGEATQAAQQFIALSKADKDLLVKFLESL